VLQQFTWLASELLTGRIFADLRDLEVRRVKQTLGRYETATAKLPLVGNAVPVDWERVLLPGATVFHLMRRNPAGGPSIPQWGGYITADPLNDEDAVEFPMTTVEAYFDRRFVGDETYTGVGQNLIVKDLVEKYAAAGPNGGIPIRVVIVSGGDGKLRDREYKDQDDKTLYSVLQDFMGVKDGPEWTVGWERQSNPERITPVLYAGDRPTFEYRFTPSTSIKETATLDEHAEGAAVELAGGTKSLQLAGDAVTSPTLNVDWFVGDDIGFKVGGQFRPGISNLGAPGVFEVDAEGLLIPNVGTQPAENGLLDASGLVAGTDGLYEFSEPRTRAARPIVPAFPTGLRGVARAIGVELDFENVPTVTPILAGDDIN